MKNKIRKLSGSLRKYIRKEKSRIHREILDIKEEKRLIQELLGKYYHKTQKDQKRIDKKTEKGKI